MGLFSSIFTKNEEERKGTLVTAQLNHLLMPIDRGDFYEDPIDDALRALDYGEVDGGGTMQLESGEIEYIDVEIFLFNLDEGIPFLIKKMEELGAPKSSVLIIHDQSNPRQIEFGKTEGVAIYLDGVNLPEEVYKTSDINEIVENFNNVLNGIGSMQSYWEGETETALYFYGSNAEKMKNILRTNLATYPLCEGCRIVTIAPKTN
ncbi:hypothetical protein [Leptospira neocaledonica]|uniref:Uncharacterized protein n=1 Tax=Leptospira neocaledonica TaxID=2023192 RepID=A0A2M9ZWC2_9LEPT|nr:hypothetical protein [Leptospira neocaledonica]PJZ76319.1 hypothetical protein CH365_13065 [Leptospira neocaledonica]